VWIYDEGRATSTPTGTPNWYDGTMPVQYMTATNMARGVWMALTRADYLEHFRNALARALSNNTDIIPLMVPGFADYIINGSRGIQADRREAVRIMLNLIWQNILGRPFNGHQMKH
jgi:hypothetical protein